ncbi:hypothetical protein [Clostridium sp. JN-1]|uniref:hypothetical protein n=1 Tax=Clostridium sp. JN-1 TaxID=2483110 RepID=UPI000F0BB3F1|nr:hypothetical protein [Clostridium sp. JN-1]
MNKKILSFIIILCTIISVFIIRYVHKVNINDNFISNKISVFNNKQNKHQNNNNDNNIKKFSYLFSDICFTNINSDYKKGKLDEIGEKFKDDKRAFFSDSSEVVKNDTSKSINKLPKSEEENKSISKISNSNPEKSLTAADMEKLNSMANKLPAVDCEKVKSWLKSGKTQDIEKALKLLKQRLSNDDYQKIKTIYDKFIS